VGASVTSVVLQSSTELLIARHYGIALVLVTPLARVVGDSRRVTSPTTAKPGGRIGGDHRCPSPGKAVLRSDNFSTADHTDTAEYAPLIWRLERIETDCPVPVSPGCRTPRASPPGCAGRGTVCAVRMSAGTGAAVGTNMKGLRVSDEVFGSSAGTPSPSTRSQPRPTEVLKPCATTAISSPGDRS